MEEPFDLPPDVLQRVPFFRELQRVLAWSGGPVNWDLARQLAISIAAGDTAAPAIDAHDDAEVSEHLRIAELWLEGAAGLTPPTHLLSARAGTAADWAEHATETYHELIDPIAAKASRALSDHAAEGIERMMAGAVGQIAPLFMGIQAGTIIGMLAREVTGTHDVIVPASEGQVVLVLPAIDAVARDYGLDVRQARQYVALREAARRIVFDGHAGVRANFFALYHNFVASLDVDLAQGLRRLQDIDITDPQRLQDALSDEGLFSPEPSSETAAASARVGDLLALIEAFIASAVAEAGARAGGMDAAAEAFRRRALGERRAMQLFHGFIGLAPPTNLRQARSFAQDVLRHGGWPLLSRALEEPEALPTRDELDDPGSWLRRI